MRIRGEITHGEMMWHDDPNRPLYSEDLQTTETLPPLNTELHSPENADELLLVRENIMRFPEGVTLNAYQSVTQLELKHPKGSAEATDRYSTGLRGEILEAIHELDLAQIEHPTNYYVNYLEGAEDAWLCTVLDTGRLSFSALSQERKEKFLGELGDILWYSARLSDEHDIPLSTGFLRFLRSANLGSVPAMYRYGHGESGEKRAAEILDFDIVQAVAVSQKNAYREKRNAGTPMESSLTIANSPAAILRRIEDDDFSHTEQMEPVQDALAVSIGKLVWFMAYTSEHILNTDFSKVMQANLQKITARSARGTIFSKQDRDEADEALIRAGEDPRQPMN